MLAINPRRDMQQTLETVTFELARPRHLEGLVELYARFFAESSYPALGLTFDRHRMIDWTGGCLLSQKVPHIIAIDQQTKVIVGTICYGLDWSCSTEPFAALDKFYVLPDWRASGIGRTLLTLALEAASADGAAAFRAGLSAGCGTAKNLFRKLGFEETPGSILLARRL